MEAARWFHLLLIAFQHAQEVVCRLVLVLENDIALRVTVALHARGPALRSVHGTSLHSRTQLYSLCKV